MICGENVQTKMQKYCLFFLTMFIYRSAKQPDEKRGEEDEQTLVVLSSAHRCSQAKCQLPTNQLH